MIREIAKFLSFPCAFLILNIVAQPFTVQDAEAQCLRARVNQNNGRVILRQVGPRPNGLCRRPHISLSDLTVSAPEVTTPKAVTTFGGTGHNGPFSTGSLDFIEVDSVVMTIPEGEEYLLLAQITAETACRKLLGDVDADSWYAARILLNGDEMVPLAGGLRFAAMDHAPDDGEAFKYRSSALQRFSDGAVGEGVHIISFEVAVNQTDMNVRVDDWAMILQALPVESE